MTTSTAPPQSAEGSRPAQSTSSSGPRPRGQGGGGPGRGPGSGGQFRGGRRNFRRGRRVCNFCVDRVNSVDYKAVNRLRRYISDRARIDSSKKTGTCAKHQRMVRRAIAKARFMALLPYAPDHTRVTNMLAPRTPAESSVTDEAEASEESTAAAEGPSKDGSAEATAEANAADAVEQPAVAQESGAVQSAPAEQAATTVEASQEGTAPASTAAAPDVAQPEDKSSSDDSEQAKV